MPLPKADASSSRVLIAAPTGVDGSLLSSVLSEQGLSCSQFERLSELAEQIDAHAGVLILAEEALEPDEMEELRNRLEAQPAWSDLPVIVLTAAGEEALLHPSIEMLASWTGNISFLERPLRVQTLVSAVRVSLRARARQYEVRNLLHQRDEILTSIRDGFVVLDRQLRFQYVNERAAELAGMTPSELLGISFYDVYPAARGSELEAALLNAFGSTHVATKEYYDARLHRWISTRIYPGDEQVTVIATDISEEKRALEELRKSEERFRLIVENAKDHAIFTLNLEGRIRTWNTGANGLFGFEVAEIIGEHEEILFPPDPASRAEAAEERKTALQTQGVRSERTMRRKNGNLFWTSGTLAPLTDESGTVRGYLRIIRDITEFRTTLKRLAASESRFRDLANAMPQIVWTALPDGTLDYFNERWIEFTGMDKPKAEAWSWVDLLHEEDREECIRRWRESVATGRPFEYAARLKHGQKSEFSWYLGRAVPGFRASGRLDRWYGTWTEIEEQKRTEAQLDQARRELEQLNRAKDQFFATLSHELRTPLTPALFIASSLQQSPGLSADAKADLETLKRNLQLETRLIDDLLDMSRIIHGKLALNLRRIDLHHLLENCIRSVERELQGSKQIEMKFSFQAKEHYTKGDEARIEQVFRNLLRNAVKFTPDQGRVTVETKNSPAGTVLVSVTDTGIGIAPEKLSSVFNAFEQGGENVTRSFGGLGLGLAIAKGLVEAHSGSIRVGSEGLGRGACFTVELPITTAMPEQKSHDEPQEAQEPAKGLKLLLVEDHVDTAAVLARLLSRAGHSISTAHSTSEAREKAAAEHFDLVLSDLGLPDGSGHELMRELHDRYGLRGIALTGFGAEADMEKSKAAGFVTHLTKPVEWAALRAAIAECAALLRSENKVT